MPCFWPDSRSKRCCGKVLVIVTLQTLIVEKRFIIGASQERVWDLLGKAIFYCLPELEKIKVVSQSTFYATLRFRVAFTWLTLNLKGELADVSPPDFMVSILKVKSKWGIIQLLLKTTFKLRSVDEGRTEVVCRATVEQMGAILGWTLIKKQRSLAVNTLDCIERRLKQVC